MRDLLATRKIMGEFFKNTREEAGISLAEAARHLQVEVPFILNIEAGLEDLNLTEIYAFANLYDVPPSRVLQLLGNLSDSRIFNPFMLLHEGRVYGSYPH